MAQPELSIIIPVYNAEIYLKGCLDSILYQNGIQYFEIIIVNDGSTDSSLKIITDYSRRYDNIIPISQPNRGVSVARNVGIEYATGKYLTFVDADDQVGISYESMKAFFAKNRPIINNGLVISKNFFHKVDDLNHTFEKTYFTKMLSVVTRFNGLDIVLAGKIGINREYQDVRQHIYPYDTYYGDSISNKKILLDHCDQRESANFALYRRDFLDKNNLYFQPEMRLDEDILFCMMAILVANKAATVSGATYLYNRHKGTLSNDINERVFMKKRMVATVQRFSAFLYFISNHTQYDTLFSSVIKQFAFMTNYTPYEDQYRFPTFTCNRCMRENCNGCFTRNCEMSKITKNLQELLPSALQMCRVKERQ